MARAKFTKETTSEEEVVKTEHKEVEDKKSSTPELPVDQNEIVDVNINMAKRRPFRINGKADNIIYLNLSDMGLYGRLNDGYNQLMSMMEEVAELGSKEGEEDDDTIKMVLDEYNQKMKDVMDYIFDAPVADACCDGGTMWDPYSGMFRFEHIIDALCGLYENNLSSEFAKMRSRVNSRVKQNRGIPAPKRRK